MKWLDAAYSSPAENLAGDEALLDLCEEEGVEILRFWESRQHFVVVGYANKIESEVNVAECRRRGVPILRRCSGGGTVVQGPGCLNYNLTLRIPESGPLMTVTGTNEFVMERHRAAMEQLLGVPVAVKGHTDLAACTPLCSPHRNRNPALNPNPTTVEDTITSRTRSKNDRPGSDAWLKFSGNAQRRRRRAFVFHGTILYGLDLSVIDILLRLPSMQPAYRSGRSHGEFVQNITAPGDSIRAALREAWNAEEAILDVPRDRFDRVLRDHYLNDAWNFRTGAPSVAGTEMSD
jgi:lipoate-protein ligase A